MYDPILEIRDLSVGYASRRAVGLAVCNVISDIEKGEIVGLAGEIGLRKDHPGGGIIEFDRTARGDPIGVGLPDAIGWENDRPDENYTIFAEADPLERNSIYPTGVDECLESGVKGTAADDGHSVGSTDLLKGRLLNAPAGRSTWLAWTNLFWTNTPMN